jgi:chromosome segregation ATPase
LTAVVARASRAPAERTSRSKGKENAMARAKTIRAKIENVEAQLAKRVRALEKDVLRLTSRLGKKEAEIKKLKDKLAARLRKDIKKKVSSVKSRIRKIVPKLG